MPQNKQQQYRHLRPEDIFFPIENLGHAAYDRRLD
jgi:hypothetical protein